MSKYPVNQGFMSLSTYYLEDDRHILRDSTVAVVVVVRTRPRAIPLAMITMRKSIHGFPLVFFMRMAPYWLPGISIGVSRARQPVDISVKEARKGFSLHARAQSAPRYTRQLNESK